MRNARVTLVAVLLMGVAACGGKSDPSGSVTRIPATGETVSVYADTSLRESFAELERRFERENPGVDVVLDFGSSADLAQRITKGAKADVFASADEGAMGAALHARGSAPDQPVAVFATNSMTIAVPEGNPKKITSLADLARPGMTVVMCEPQVPCGRLTRRLFGAAGVAVEPAGEETDAIAVRDKVAKGGADAGIVYQTDVQAERTKLDGVDFPEASLVVDRYPIAVLREARDPAVAVRFMTMVKGAVGQEVLRAAGFQIP